MVFVFGGFTKLLKEHGAGLEFVFNPVYLTIWNINAGFDVLKNT